MKKILFRGKHTDTSEWFKGYLANGLNWKTKTPISVIIPTRTLLMPHGRLRLYVPVDLKTVGQFVNRYDIHNVGIFEGDIVNTYDRQGKLCGKAIVIDQNSITVNGSNRWWPQDTVELEVIGNVHDNPELIGKKEVDLYKYYHCLEVEDRNEKNTYSV